MNLQTQYELAHVEKVKGGQIKAEVAQAA